MAVRTAVAVAGTLSAHSLPEIHQCPAGTVSRMIVLMLLAITTAPGWVADKIFTVLALAVLPFAPSAGVVAVIAAIRPPAPITAAAPLLLRFIWLPFPGRPTPDQVQAGWPLIR